FGHQVPRWKTSRTGPPSRYSVSERTCPFWLGSSKDGACRSVDGSGISGIRVIPWSEQLHFHQLSRLDDVGLRGNLDVAVGVCHARDVPRALEGGHSCAVLHSDGIELMTPGRRYDASRQWKRDNARLV